MEWQQVVGFYHAARLLSFTRAAEITLRTQSALSQQIKALETELGCALFERVKKRRLRLTPEGEVVFRFAGSVLEKQEALRGDLDRMKGSHKGPLTVAAPFTTLYHLLPEKLKAYLERFPEVEVTLLDRPQARVVELVQEGEADFGMTLESLTPKGLASIRWEKVRTVLMMARGHPLGKLKRLTLKHVAGYPLILPPKGVAHGGRALLEEQFRKLGVGYRVVMESSNVELSSLYVGLGLGISFATMADCLPESSPRNLEFISLDHCFKPDYVVIVMRKSMVLSGYKQAFLSVLLARGTDDGQSFGKAGLSIPSLLK